MSTSEVSLRITRLKTPRAAALAGILFALLFGASVVLIRLTVPADPEGNAWVAAHAKRVSLALNLLPYAGIAFLWFIGVIRDRLGDVEDRFFSTVFLGSGLMFLALVFFSGAMAGGLVNFLDLEPSSTAYREVLVFSRAVMFESMNVYAIRMAGVFMISLGTIWYRTGLMHRLWALITYAFALILLLSINYSPWVVLIFPAWVLAVSIYILILSFRPEAPEALSMAGDA